ncbi:PilZ domain-containing protein [Caenimonas terrae]|uniref:PilZ domain-containing protein n=1 Tax=Caenimonas terrae TaxID=696074 RepID=A0ABW0NF16_9BURK
MQQHTHPSQATDAVLIHPRSGDRFGIALAVTMDDGEGETLDISETGILYETSVESQPQVGAKVAMTLEYSVDGHDYRTRCEAEVVRVERVGNRVNVATRLLSPLQSAQ